MHTSVLYINALKTSKKLKVRLLTIPIITTTLITLISCYYFLFFYYPRSHCKSFNQLSTCIVIYIVADFIKIFLLQSNKIPLHGNLQTSEKNKLKSELSRDDSREKYNTFTVIFH